MASDQGIIFLPLASDCAPRSEENVVPLCGLVERRFERTRRLRRQRWRGPGGSTDPFAVGMLVAQTREGLLRRRLHGLADWTIRFSWPARSRAQDAPDC